MDLRNLFNKPNQYKSSALISSNQSVRYIGNKEYLETLYKIPQFVAGLSLYTQIATLPIYLYKQDKKGNITKLENDYRVSLLNETPNIDNTGYSFKKDIISDLIIYGKAYSLIEKRGIDINGLHYIKSNTVTKRVIYDKSTGITKDLVYDYTLNSVKNTTDYTNMIDINFGKGVINYSDIISMLLDELDNYQKLKEQSVSPSGVLTTEGRLNNEQINNLRSSFESLYSGSNAKKTLILENGIEYKQLNGSSDNDIKLDNDNLATMVEYIMELPPGALSDSSEEMKSLVYDRLKKLMVSIEESLNRILLLETEKDRGYFFAFDDSESNIKPKEDNLIENVSSLLSNGIISLNEARYRLNLPSVENDYKLHSLGNVMEFTDNEKLYIPNTNETINLGDLNDVE